MNTFFTLNYESDIYYPIHHIHADHENGNMHFRVPRDS